MKVAYDVSVLGQGYINPKAKTGIYRVVESLFLELINYPFTDLSAISFNQFYNVWDEYSSKLYFQESRPNLNHFFTHCSHSHLNLSSLYQKTIKLQRYLIHNSISKYNPIYKLALALQIPFKILGKIETEIQLEKQYFDVYHSPFYSLPNKNIENKIPKILTIYDLIPVLYPEKFTIKIKKQFLNIIKSINKEKDWILCISENTKKDFCGYTGMNPKRVFVTPLAAASHFYPVRDRELIAITTKKYNIPDLPYLLSLCTLEPRKNLSFLIKCFSQIIIDNPSLDINLVLVGVYGWKNKEIFQAATKDSNLKNRIIFTGYVPDENLSAIYSGATAFVYPSLYEGFGLPPLEAMQCGTPVITSNTSSLPEVVGEAGIMIDPKQEDDLCHVLLKVINDSQLRTTLSQKGIERAKQFSWSKCAEETVKVYQIATNSKSM